MTETNLLSREDEVSKYVHSAWKATPNRLIGLAYLKSLRTTILTRLARRFFLGAVFSLLAVPFIEWRVENFLLVAILGMTVLEFLTSLISTKGRIIDLLNSVLLLTFSYGDRSLSGLTRGYKLFKVHMMVDTTIQIIFKIILLILALSLFSFDGYSKEIQEFGQLVYVAAPLHVLADTITLGFVSLAIGPLGSWDGWEATYLWAFKTVLIVDEFQFALNYNRFKLSAVNLGILNRSNFQEVVEETKSVDLGSTT